jgi:hypothetical protein
LAVIRGQGVAASCCAHLLGRGGLAVTMDHRARFPVPALMLGETAQKLLEDVFESPKLFDGLPRVRKRVVAWGDVKPVEVPHSGVVIPEHELLDRINSLVHAPGTLESEWKILAMSPLPEHVEEHQFGSRMAQVAAVKLKSGFDTEACWIESLDEGWLFLLPAGEGTGWLLSVGGATLAASRLVAEQVDGSMSEPAGAFPAHPRIADPLCEDGWLACGTAAIGFDPLCGDGTGNAVREAILGSAVIRAAAQGGEVYGLARHYRSRLLYGFRKHLEACRQFYQSGGSGPWWMGELAALERGLNWCAGRIDTGESTPYRLNGFSLELVAP